MIYKVVTVDYFPMAILDSLAKSKAQFLLADNILYLYSSASKKKISNKFKGDYLIKELKDFSREGDMAREWCESKFKQQINDNIIEERQDELKAKLAYIDAFENFLKEGGENSD